MTESEKMDDAIDTILGMSVRSSGLPDDFLRLSIDTLEKALPRLQNELVRRRAAVYHLRGYGRVPARAPASAADMVAVAGGFRRG